MAGPNKPPTKGAKPFLGDDDLLSELDAWDSTFDALHAEDTGSQMPQQEVMAWPAPTPAPDAPAVARAADLIDPSSAIDQPVFGSDETHAELSLDDADDSPDATIDVEIEMPRRRNTSSMADTFDADPEETDFSDVGAEGAPAALGPMLGRHQTLPPIDDVDEGQTRIDLKSGPIRAIPSDDDDDGVFTSASRPIAAVAPSDEFVVDPIAPPPAPEKRRPAIVRRTPMQVPQVPQVPARRDDVTPARGVEVSEFGEQTRIQDLGEIQAQAAQSRPLSRTAPPPILDDEYEVEIDSSSSEAPEPIPETAVSRRTAHVVRRAETPTRPPPATYAPGDDDDDDLALEMDVDEPSPYEQSPAQEDDFSDVAAAVGANEDDALGRPSSASGAIARRRPSTPQSEAGSGSHPAIRPSARGPAMSAPEPPPELDDALSGLDEAVAQVDDDDAQFGLPERSAPTLADRPRDRSGPARVPEIPVAPDVTEHYARVKTPTSVPPLASRTPVDEGAPMVGGEAPQRLVSTVPLEIEEPEVEPQLDLDAAVRAWPEQTDPLASTALDEAAAQSLLVYERELATIDDTAVSAALRIEAGRLSERLADPDRARAHYDAALLADPRATAALRGLRRLARASGDLVEAVQHLDAEIAVAGALERRPLGHYRIDLLMASGEQDLARVAVGETLDHAPSDVRALLAHLELAFLDGRADEFGAALEQLAHAITDPELRAAVQSARGALAAHHNDTAGAAGWLTAAAESDPTSLAARIGAVRHAAAQVDGPGAARALIDLARQIEITDPVTAAAAAVRAQQWSGGELGAQAAAIATTAAPSDPLVARLAAETAAAGDPAQAAIAYAHWASTGASAIERAYAAARAAELEPARGGELWGAALQLDPGDDYGAAQLRTAYVATEATQAAIDVDLSVATDLDRERARLRAAYGLISQGELEQAFEVLKAGRAARPGSLALAEALGEALAAAGRWNDRAKLFAELAAEPGDQLDKDVAHLRSALAW